MYTYIIFFFFTHKPFSPIGGSLNRINKETHVCLTRSSPLSLGANPSRIGFINIYIFININTNININKYGIFI